jgi:uncharacterized protein with PIN domain
MHNEPGRAFFRFYAELNDHLAAEQQYKTLEKSFFISGAVKDMIESFGVPHTEVDLILANGRPVDFSYQVQYGDRIAVYPVFESFDVGREQRLRPEPLRNPTFLLDVHLGKLAAYLRMLGFDAQYGRWLTDAELAQISAGKHRILLTRDRGLLKHGAITHGYWVRETDSRRQIEEVMHRFDLRRSIRPFTRCMACNGILEPISRERARTLMPRHSPERARRNAAAERFGAPSTPLHPAHPLDRYEEFRYCEHCGRVYWKGSHYARMHQWIEQLSSG